MPRGRAKKSMTVQMTEKMKLVADCISLIGMSSSGSNLNLITLVSSTMNAQNQMTTHMLPTQSPKTTILSESKGQSKEEAPPAHMKLDLPQNEEKVWASLFTGNKLAARGMNLSYSPPDYGGWRKGG